MFGHRSAAFTAAITAAPWLLISIWLIVHTFLPVVIVTGVGGWKFDRENREISLDVEMRKILPCAIIAGSTDAFGKSKDGAWTAMPVVEGVNTAVTHRAGSHFFRRWAIYIPENESSPERIFIRVDHVCDEGVVKTDLGPFIVPASIRAEAG